MGHGTISAAHIDALGAARRHLDTETRTVFDDHEAALLEHAQRDSRRQRSPGAAASSPDTSSLLDRPTMPKNSTASAPTPPSSAGSTRSPACTSPSSSSTRSATRCCGPQSTPTSAPCARTTATPRHRGCNSRSMRSSPPCSGPIRSEPAGGARDDVPATPNAAGRSPRSPSSSISPRCSTGSTPPASARPKTASRSRCRPCDGCAATPRSCPSCSTARAWRSTSDAPGAPSPAPNDGRCERCTAAADTPSARCRSRRARSTTSAGGGSTTARPTSTI